MEENNIIKTEVLCKSFVTDGEINNVIKNMNLEVKTGDFTVIMGSSGSGKSTLLYLLSGMDEATSGKIFLAGRELSVLKEKELAEYRKKEIGFVFQAINLIPDLSIDENIASPTYKNGKSRAENEARIERLIEVMELTGHRKKFPNQLSGGQRQRVAICRALVNNPQVLFADEPTGSLNSSQGKNVLDTFTKLHEQKQTIVMVTHDLKAALRGNRIIYLRDGRIDGELTLKEYKEEELEERERCVYQFLKERGW